MDLGLPAYMDGRTGDKSLAKAVNRGILLQLLRQKGSVSRASLAKASGLNKATVSSQIAELISLGIVKETGAGNSELGRKPVMLEIDGASGYVMGISISTEHLHVIVRDIAGKLIRDELRNLISKDAEGVIRELKVLIAQTASSGTSSKFGLLGVGIAVPGAVDLETEMVVRSAKLDWTRVPLRPALTDSFGGLLHIGNDATLATIAERELFAPDAQDLVCVLIDEGIGSGAYINGSIHYGHHGRFGEVGHMTIVHGGRRCPCGNIGCWDLYGSEMALRQRLAEKRGGGLPTSEDLIVLARELPSWSADIFDEFTAYLTTGIASLINAFAPSMVVVNSAVLEASPSLFDRLKEGLSDRAMAHFPVCELRLSSLGKGAPAIGACMAVEERFFKDLIFGSVG